MGVGGCQMNKVPDFLSPQVVWSHRSEVGPTNFKLPSHSCDSDADGTGVLQETLGYSNQRRLMEEAGFDQNLKGAQLKEADRNRE